MAEKRRAIGIPPLSVTAEQWLQSCPDKGLAIKDLIEVAASKQLPPPPALPSLRGRRGLRSSVRAEVLRMKTEDVKPRGIAEELGVSRSWVYKILGGAK